jgi:tetratricopeptide (TPR) repeat protein
MPASPADTHLDAAQAAINKGEHETALRQLRFGFLADPAHRPLYQTASSCLRQMQGDEEAQLFEEAYSQFEDPTPFYRLGSHFSQIGQTDLAVPFLERSLQLAPDNIQIATELGLAYTSAFQPQRARQVLARFLDRGDYWASYQYYWSSLLLNQPDGVREFIKISLSDLTESDLEPRVKAAVRYTLDQLERALHRLDIVQPPEDNIRDWHFIQYGAAILDVMDQRISQDGDRVAGGRYVALWPQYEKLSGVLHKADRLLEAIGRRPNRVLALPDRESEILGRALAIIMDLPFQSATAAQAGMANQVIVAADNRLLRFPELANTKPDQSLIAVNLNWLEDSPINPDVCGFMTQLCRYPWEAGSIRVDPDSEQMQETPADERPAEEIAAELAETEPEQDHSFEDALHSYKSHAIYLAGGAKGGPHRPPFRTDSPLPGAYFA